MEQQNIQVTTTKKIPTKLVAVMVIIAVVLLTFIIGGLVILANNNRGNNNSNGDNNTTVTPTPTSIAQCEYEGIKYESGQSFEKGDSCNTCSCENGIVSCEEKLCEKEYTTILNRYRFINGEVTEKIPYKIEFESSQSIEIEELEEREALLISNENQFEIVLSLIPDSAGVGFDSLPNMRRLFNSQLDKEIIEIQVTKSENTNLKFTFEYGENYREQNCFEGVACFSPNIGIEFPNNNDFIILDARCNLNDIDDQIYCDEIIESFNISKN